MIRIIVGFCITAFSAYIGIVAISDLISGDSETRMGVLLGLVLFFGLFTIGGIWLMVSAYTGRKKRRKALLETTLLRIIRNKGGKVTPVEVAAECDLNVTEAKNALDALCDSGSGQLQITDDGNMVYVFHGFLKPYQKASSKSPLDK